METELVTPAMKSSRNHAKPIHAPPAMWLKMRGVVRKARPKVPPSTACAVPAGPKKRNAAGTTIDPPSTTSANSFRNAAVVEGNSTSSRDFMYVAYVSSTPMPTDVEKKTWPAASSQTLPLLSAAKSGFQRKPSA